MVAVWHKPPSGRIGIFGQSNAEGMTAEANGKPFGQVDKGADTYAGHFQEYFSLADPADMNGTSLAEHWQPSPVGTGMLEEMIALYSALPKGLRHYLFWAQGEADAGVTAWADAYLSNLQWLVPYVHAQTGLTNTELAWGIVRLHANNTGSGTAADRTKVRDAQNTITASPPTVLGGAANMQLIVVDSVPLADGVHWTVPGSVTVGHLLLAAANSAYGFSQRYTGL